MPEKWFFLRNIYIYLAAEPRTSKGLNAPEMFFFFENYTYIYLWAAEPGRKRGLMLENVFFLRNIYIYIDSGAADEKRGRCPMHGMRSLSLAST